MWIARPIWYSVSIMCFCEMVRQNRALKMRFDVYCCGGRSEKVEYVDPGASGPLKWWKSAIYVRMNVCDLYSMLANFIRQPRKPLEAITWNNGGWKTWKSALGYGGTSDVPFSNGIFLDAAEHNNAKTGVVACRKKKILTILTIFCFILVVDFYFDRSRYKY